ncbi:MAG TPA: SCP2 sterol-binding domain-containing protein [Acidimicrobiales bacterium]|nr:SCP2 sterol-binding domain-containing protein [Acidimicrobiales bacterium]
MAYKFLSDEWVEAAKKIREDAESPAAAPAPVKMNLVITDVPFGDGTVEAHMDTTSGELELDTGHVDAADVTATLDYDTAKAMMVDANPQAAMQAFMAGKIKLQGDMTKAMALQGGPADPEMTKKIQAITE